MSTDGAYPWSNKAVAPSPLSAMIADALHVADGVIQTGRWRHVEGEHAQPSDALVPVLQRTRRKDEAATISDGLVKSVHGAYLLTNTRSIYAWPRPNGWLDSRYPDGVDGFQPNLQLVPMLGTGVLDSRFLYGQPNWTIADTVLVGDGFVKSVVGASALGKNMQIVPVSYSGVLDSRYWDGLTPLLPDITAPYPLISLDASVTSGNVVNLSWPVTSDQTVAGRITSGVAQYNVRRDGSFLDSTTDLTFVDYPSAGAHYYNVRAEDGAGNISGDSPSAFVSLSVGSGNVLSNAQLSTLGFISITAAPYSADPTGVTDATTRIQAAIDYASQNDYSVWVPSGTYLVSNTVRCYRWQTEYTGGAPNIHHSLYGATYPSRPVFKLKANATGFSNVNSPKPVVYYNMWRVANAGLNGTPPPSNQAFDPYGGPGADWQRYAANNFNQSFHNIDIDTGGNAGADGICFKTAQGAYLGNVTVTASGSNVAFRHTGGRGSPGVNLTAIGGRYGVSAATAFNSVDAPAGLSLFGLRCLGQSVAAYEVGDFVPGTVAGFYFTRVTNGSVVSVSEDSATANRTLVLVDGVIETPGGTAFVNTPAKTCYLRNVYVKGTNDLIRTGTLATVVGSGTWKRIAEYASNDMDGAIIPPGTGQTGATTLAHQSLINGTLTRTQVPVSTIESNASAPPGDIVTRHAATIPTLDGDDYLLMPAASAADCVNSLNAMINSAEFVGHNRVVLRRGTYYAGNTVNMKRDTQLLGTGLLRTTLHTHDSWSPATGSPYLLSTESYANGTAALVGLTLSTHTSPLTRHRFSHILWRAGRRSMSYDVRVDWDYLAPSTTGHPRVPWTFLGVGGGRHYGIELNGRGASATGGDYRAVLVNSTAQPLQLYGPQLEISKNEEAGATAYANIEVRGACNVRVYGMKREGSSPTLIINVGSNVALYGSGGMRSGGMTLGQFGAYGACDQLLAACILPQGFQGTAGNYTLAEDLASSPPVGATWPQGISIYKRGTLDDAAMQV